MSFPEERQKRLECGYGRQRGIRAPHKPSHKQQAGVCENPQHIKILYSAEGDTEWPSVLQPEDIIQACCVTC